MTDDQLSLRYVPLETLALWDRNPKKHDLETLAVSIRQYGFKDPPKFEPSLNGGHGGLIEGNGRAEVLQTMQKGGEKPPRGIGVDEAGTWHAPVLFGVDAASRAEAEAYGVDHNALTLGGSGFGLEDLVQLFDESALQALLEDTPEAGALLASLDASDLDALLGGPDFEPVSEDEQSRLDEKTRIVCPECGAEISR